MTNSNTDNISELIQALRDEANQREQRRFLMTAVVTPYTGKRNPSQVKKFFMDILRKAEGFELTDDQLIILAARNLDDSAWEWYLQHKKIKGPFVSFQDFKDQLLTQFIGTVDIN